ncbi:MAG TPA: acylneuraminate cytidylyltransferase family protein [Pseudonocardiaceae bacterium]|nr:acylneuraminate cytidylyltransferase family protein [Pseudonocardiaceae bacterium]
MSPDVVAVVPARGGSVGFPGKNLAMFLGRSLVANAVAAGLGAADVDRVLVTTDDELIGRAALDAGAELVRRPAELAGPDSRTVDAVVHAVDEQGLADRTVIVLLQPTSPLRTSDDVVACLALHGRRSTGSVVQVTDAGHHPWKSCVLVDGALVPVRGWPDLEAPRQSLPPPLRPTGGVYVVTAGDLRAHRRFFVPAVLAQVIPADRAVDVDSPADLALAAARARELGWT